MSLGDRRMTKISSSASRSIISALAIEQSVNDQASWQEQDDILRDMWLSGKAIDEIAITLGRSPSATMTRAARIGLPRRNRPGRHRRGFSESDPNSDNRRIIQSSEYADSVKTSQQGQQNKTDPAAPKLRVIGGSRVSVESDSLSPSGGMEPVRLIRVCLMCLNKFTSQGRHNRICIKCKSSESYETLGAASQPVSIQGSGV